MAPKLVLYGIPYYELVNCRKRMEVKICTKCTKNIKCCCLNSLTN